VQTPVGASTIHLILNALKHISATFLTKHTLKTETGSKNEYVFKYSKCTAQRSAEEIRTLH